MSKDYLADYSTTNTDNTDIGGIDVAENCAAGNLNNAVREVMTHLKVFSNEFKAGAAIASAAALPVNVAGVSHNVTGATGVTSLADPTNDTSHIKILQFSGIVTLTHSANLQLGGSDITTAANDVLTFVYEGSSVWRLFSIEAAATLKANETTSLSVGYTRTVYDHGTQTTGTLTPNVSQGGQQKVINGGAFTLAPTSEVGEFLLYITNNGSAGSITTSGFDLEIGDSFDTTDTNSFECLITNNGTTSILQITALQ